MRGLAAGRRCLALAGAALVAGVSSDVATAPTADSRSSLLTDEAQHLAVVVPAYQGDLDRAVASLERWPTNCSPLTVENVDLVLYYAEGAEDSSAVEEAAGAIAATAGRCFANLRVVYAHLEKEEDAYPKGPSVMFFKMFLDQSIRSQLSEYDALAIVEWDVLVATDRSFEELYHAAFRVNEEFWVKGSNLEGTNLHSSAEMSEMWRVLGHINGNAIYNNNDPAFVEYVEYTRARWEYKYPYDVALWLTISDFPYSWPLYQRYSSKFVITNLISYVGYEHVTHDTVSDAIAGQTLFIHGSRVDEGSSASIKKTAAAKKAKKSQTAKTQRRWRRLNGLEVEPEADTSTCRAACGSEESRSALPDGTSTVCDPTCGGDDARYDGFLCGAGDSELFGDMCRLCYVCPGEARKAEAALRLSSAGAGAEKRAVIMCDTMEPPAPKEAAVDCGEKCASRKDTVCDATCGTSRHGDYNCDWKGLGSNCRHCYDDLEVALAADDVAKRHGGRVIMCSTMEPPQTSASAGSASSPQRKLKGSNVSAVVDAPATGGDGLRSFFRWRDAGKLSKKDASKSQQQEPVRKWRRLSEESSDKPEPEPTCYDTCATMEDGGMMEGRVCDDTCEDGDPYGMLGCAAMDGDFGAHCRSCFYSMEKALEYDTHDDRAIMCDTMLPVDVYTPTPDRDIPDTPDSPDLPEDQPPVCESGCAYINSAGTKGRVCDDSCEDGDPYGTLGCAAKSGRYGPYCRACFYDVEKALKADSPSDRAIMCDTLRPVDVYTPTPDRDVPDSPESQDEPDSPDTPDSPDLDRDIPDLDCRDTCEYTSRDGTMGRTCDASCADGIPYGTNGCNTKDGQYGPHCRFCYNSVKRAKKEASADGPGIMCDTLLPVDAYGDRRLSHTTHDLSTSTSSKKPFAKKSRAVHQFEDAAKLPFTEDTTRGSLCAFVAGRADEVEEWTVTVESIRKFAPGMRVAVAAEEDAVEAYEMAVGQIPGVAVSSTRNAITAGLYADQYCGVSDTSLIMYVTRGSVFSRSFTSKDTHSPRGDLLVVYSSARASRHDSELAKRTARLVGGPDASRPPSFTYGTDLMLPVGANNDLREWLVSGDPEATQASIELLGLEDPTAVPQILAALQYSRQTEGIWFLDPQTWVSENLFKEASIWNIPLVKPRFTCAINLTLLRRGDDLDVADVLRDSLDFFSRGGKCPNGLIDFKP